MGIKLTVDTFCAVLAARGLPAPEREHRFHPSRRWRFDLAWPALRLALEVDGGTWAQGRHTRGQGYAEDCRKLNEAAALGWAVLRVTTDMLRSGEAFGLVERVLRERLEAAKKAAQTQGGDGGDADDDDRER